MIEHAWKRFMAAYKGPRHSELKQDIFVLFITNSKRQGWFVEFGAMDGLRASNTLLLEQNYDWQGILSEPNPRYNTNLSRNRKCIIDFRCVSDQSGSQVAFQCADRGGWPGMVGYIYQEENSQGRVIQVDTVSLNDLLDHHHSPNHIDYISVDTDGSESMIMHGFDFNRHSATVWSIEHNEAAWRQDVCKLMTDHGYTRVLEKYSGYDDWYVKNNILEKFS